MKRYEHDAGGVTLHATAMKAQGALVEDVFRVLQSTGRSDPLRPGMRIRFGWTLFTLEAAGGDLVVCEPDFDADPLTGTRPTIAASLDVIARQASFARAHRVVPVDVTFDQILVARRGAISKPNIQAFRDQPEPPDDSGWSVSVTDTAEASDDPDDYEALPTYRLLSLRPALLPALILPPAYGVFVERDRIARVLAPPET